jgi:hypothetical protein
MGMLFIAMKCYGVIHSLCYLSFWCLLFVLIRHGLGGGSGPQRWIRALGKEAGNPIMAFHRPRFSPSFERAPHHTTTENPLRAVVHRLNSVVHPLR